MESLISSQTEVKKQIQLSELETQIEARLSYLEQAVIVLAKWLVEDRSRLDRVEKRVEMSLNLVLSQTTIKAGGVQ